MERILRPVPSACLVAILALVVYAPVLDGEFVFDDWMLLASNEAVQDISRPGKYFTEPDTLSLYGALHSYRPLRTLLFAVEWQLFGDTVAAYRAVSAGLHALVSIVLLALLRRWTGRFRGALAAAAIFAVHPVATECVPWISIQGDLISIGALLLALLVLGEPSSGRIVAALGLFLLSAGTKESGVVLPALLVVRILFLPRAEGSGRRWAVAAGAVIVLAIGYTVLRQTMVTVVAGQSAAHREWYGGSWPASVGAFFTGLVFYAATILCPVQMTLRWSPPAPPRDALDAAALAFGILIAVGILFLAARGRRRYPVPAAGMLMALLVLGPASSILIALPSVTEVRYLYPVLPFVLLALTPTLDRVRPAMIAAIVALLGALAISRAGDWRSNETLWASAVERPRSTPEALFNLGHARHQRAARCYDDGRHREELEHLLSARFYFIAYANERTPHRHVMAPIEVERLVTYMSSIADRLLDLGHPEDAIDAALVSLDFGGPTPEHLRLLARALEGLGRNDEARNARADADRIESGGASRE